ncbi:MAG: hypothetical protein OEQ30_11760, partial [Gammaproteobacteria bacterium]|nr:hypothetical protein [Gammaproteobacteria bacterium]
MSTVNRNLWIVFSVALAAIVAGTVFMRSATPPESKGGQLSDTPAVTQGGKAGLPAASGSVAAVDPDAHFTHFRVGERNVKTILSDGDIVWVGTSAGVIRYDTR